MNNMASNSSRNLLLFATVLLYVFAPAAATRSYCFPGMVGSPSDLIPSCRDYVEQATCGFDTEGPPFMARDDCCKQLAAIPQHCRCEALRYFIGRRSRPDQIGGLIDLAGCPREPQRDFARILVTPGQCNLATIHNAPYCLAMDGSQWH
uniref:Avena alpha amylase trypsin inhibitor-2 n=1 Tax=Avena murphyi TaxID=37663 RepID=A0A1B2LQC7_9POAL|nr:avena alpha amylase trypsin inhibitor-2 [Avena murphyi]